MGEGKNVSEKTELKPPGLRCSAQKQAKVWAPVSAGPASSRAGDQESGQGRYERIDVFSFHVYA